AAIERAGAGWRANPARGASAPAAGLTAEQERLCVEAAETVGADYAGVDLLRAADGRARVLELHSVPGRARRRARTGADVAGAVVAHLETVVSAARAPR